MRCAGIFQSLGQSRKGINVEARQYLSGKFGYTPSIRGQRSWARAVG